MGDNAKRTHAAGGGSAEIKALYEITPMLGLRMLLGGDTVIDWLAGYYIDNEEHVKGEVDWQSVSLEVDYSTAEGKDKLEQEIIPVRKGICTDRTSASGDIQH